MRLFPLESGVVVDGLVLVYEQAETSEKISLVEPDIRGAWLETIYAFAELSFIEPIISINMNRHLIYLYRKQAMIRDKSQNVLAYIIFFKEKDLQTENLEDFWLADFEKIILKKLEEMTTQFENEFEANAQYNFCNSYNSFKETISAILNYNVCD